MPRPLDMAGKSTLKLYVSSECSLMANVTRQVGRGPPVLWSTFMNFGLVLKSCQKTFPEHDQAVQSRIMCQVMHRRVKSVEIGVTCDSAARFCLLSVTITSHVKVSSSGVTTRVEKLEVNRAISRCQCTLQTADKSIHNV